MPRISRWAAGGGKFYRLKTARGVKNLGSMTLPDGAPLSQFVISLGLVSSNGKCKERQRGILILRVCSCFLILSLKHFCVLDRTPVSAGSALAADRHCLKLLTNGTEKLCFMGPDVRIHVTKITHEHSWVLLSFFHSFLHSTHRDSVFTGH